MPQVIIDRGPGKPRRVVTMNDEESRTVQQDKDNADIRKIMARYQATGVVDHLRAVDLAWRDVTEFTDMSDALRQSKDAEAQFMKLPSKLREAFDHDVGKWLDVAHDGVDHENHTEVRGRLEKLGVLDTPEEETPAVVEPAPAAAPEEAPAE